MTRLDCHAHFLQIAPEDRPELAGELVHDGGRICLWAASATALASLSGALEDARDLDDCIEALAHGDSLLSCGVLSPDQLHEEGREILEELSEWAEGMAKARG